MPSNHLVLGHPLLLLPSTFPSRAMHKNVQGNPTHAKTPGIREPQEGGRVGWQREEPQVGHTGGAGSQGHLGDAPESQGRAEQGAEAGGSTLQAERRDAVRGRLSQKASQGSLGPTVPIHRRGNRGSKPGGTCPCHEGSCDTGRAGREMQETRQGTGRGQTATGGVATWLRG